MSPGAKLFTVTALGAAAVAFAAAPATADTFQVSGQFIPDDQSGTNAHMTGGLVGKWRMVKFKEIAKSPLIRARGTERFEGCVDVARDGSCAGDPTGTLRFTFLYWAKPGSKPNSTTWGACWHPIVKGTGAFAGAQGVLTMVDTPQADGTMRTDYLGNVTVAGTAKPTRASAATAPRCGMN